MAHRVSAVQEGASRASGEERMLLRRHRGESVERATVGPTEVRVRVAHAGHEGAALAVEDARVGEVLRLEFLADGDDPLALDQDVAPVRLLTAMDWSKRVSVSVMQWQREESAWDGQVDVRRVEDINIDESDFRVLVVARDLDVWDLEARVRLGLRSGT